MKQRKKSENKRIVRRRRPRAARVIFADSEKDADILYATRVFVPDPFLFFQFRNKKYIIIGGLEYSRVRKEARVDCVYSFLEALALGGAGEVKQSSMADMIQSVFKHLKIGVAEVPRSFPLGLADELRVRGIKVEAQADPFFPERSKKGKAEIKAIRQVLRATEHGMEVAAQALREARIKGKRGGELFLGNEPLTSERMRSLIHKALLDKQCLAANTIVACGRQSYDPHQRGYGALRAEKPVIVDIFPRSELSGYYGDMTRTFVKGKASDKIRGMFGAVQEAQRLAISRIKGGVQARKIHESVMDVFEKRGFPTGEERGAPVGFIHGTGHGLGLDLHEHPRISVRPDRLVEGNVVTVEPGLYYPDVGGVRLEDVVLVEDGGAQKLTRLPQTLEIE